MSLLVELYRSPMTKKAVMAVTGVILFGFVLTHMAGNLKLYFGPGVGGEEAPINVYGEWLREIGEPAAPHGAVLWVMRLGLLAAVVLHIGSAYQLTMLNRRARPQRYANPRHLQATYASRTMRWGGVILLLFILYHLAHLTFGVAHPDFIPGDVYHNVVLGFQNPLVAAFYVLANLALGLHLYHGLWSLFQTLGLNHASYRGMRRRLALTFALIVTAGNISFPLAVLTGLVR